MAVLGPRAGRCPLSAGLGVLEGGPARIRASNSKEPRRAAASTGARAMANQDMKAAESTYGSFLSLLKVGTILTAIVTVIVVLLIS